MRKESGNIYHFIPQSLERELFQDIVKADDIRIERIISQGHSSPDHGWYDQDENEWVIVLQGSGTLIFEDGSSATLQKGDYINIPAHKRHKVSWTDPDNITVWLAVSYKQPTK